MATLIKHLPSCICRAQGLLQLFPFLHKHVGDIHRKGTAPMAKLLHEAIKEKLADLRKWESTVYIPALPSCNGNWHAQQSHPASYTESMS